MGGEGYEARLRALYRFCSRQIVLAQKERVRLECENYFPIIVEKQGGVIDAFQKCRRELERLFPEIDFTPAKKK